MLRRISLSAVLLVAACNDGSVNATAPSGARPTPVANAALAGDKRADARLLARTIAMSMRRPGVAEKLRNAMRDSRWTDHKLLLADFVHGAVGRSVVAEVAVSAQTTPDDLVALVDRLPAMDFYVPFRDHRLSWRGTSEVLVAAAFEANAPSIEAFSPDGWSHSLLLEDGVPKVPLLIIHPSEPKGTLASSEAFSSGDVIELRAESGRTTSHVILPDDTTGSGGGPGYPAGIYLTYFYSHRGDGWFGSLEMEFHSRAWEGTPFFITGTNGTFNYPGGSCSKGDAVYTFEPGIVYSTVFILVSQGVTNVANAGCTFTSTPRGYEVQAIESDGGLNGSDDDFGRRFFGVSGGLPYGGVIGTTLPYYSNCGNPGGCGLNSPDGELSVNMRLSYN